jgi:hypothetical protein
MADGDARERPGGRGDGDRGAGLTNALTEAVKASTPLVLLVGAAPRQMLRRPHDGDPAAVCSALRAGLQRARQG